MYIGMGWECRQEGQNKECYMILIGKLVEKRPLVRRRRRWENNIKINVMEIFLG
jgi:hypothetical protein